MAIDRTAFNGLVDDDGSNTVGTPWNKAAIAGVILDPVDAALAGPLAVPMRIGPALNMPMGAGPYHDINPGSVGHLYTPWLMVPAAAAIITGIAAEADGTQHLLINASGVTVTLNNQDAGSLAANRFYGPGYANYTIGIFCSVWIVYIASQGSWFVLGK